MPDPAKYSVPQPLKSLNVLPHSGKVEQLRAELAATPRQAVPNAAREEACASDSVTILRASIIDVLQTIFDPEIPVSIYELGLIYEIMIDELAQSAQIKMTLTAPGCPVAGSLVQEVQQKVQTVPGISSATVELVWEPAWTKDRMSEAALLDLGLV